MKKLTQEELLMVEELQQYLSGETYTVLMEEDTSEKEKYREAKREFIQKCSQLFVVDGAEFLCGPHRGILKGGVAWNTIDDNPSATEKECKKENFIFQDGFQVLSIGKWSRLSETTTLEDAIPLLFRSTIQITGKMPGNTPTETYNLKFITAGQNFVFEDTTDEEYEREVLGEEQKPPLLVTNVAGPFDEKGELVSAIERKNIYIYKITGFSRLPTSEELQQLKWSAQFDGNEYIQLSLSEGRKEARIRVNKLKGFQESFKEFAIYPYFKEPSKKVCIKAKIKNTTYPFLIAQGKRKLGKNKVGNLCDDLFYADFDFNWSEVIIKDKLHKGILRQGQKIGTDEGDVKKDKFNKVYESIMEYKGVDKKILKEKLITEGLLSLGHYAKPYFELLCTEAVKGEKDFFIQDREGNFNRYEIVKVSKELHSLAREMKPIQNFIANTSYHLKNIIKNEKNISTLELQGDDLGEIYELFSNKHPKVSPPNFDFDIWDGFSIINEVKGDPPSNIKMSFSLLFHGIWTYKIYLKSYNDQTKEGVFEYHLQDHFGLDVLDIMVHSKRFFIEWFILQHFWGVKPYATELIFEEPFKIDN
mgnify:CR=1 FL=1